MKNYVILKREIESDYGKEIVIEKKYNLCKDQHKNRLWVLQPALYNRLMRGEH